ncbi:hypothetical protein COL940_011854 [Colletotrichum noveboracense]|nr:hypothetical protein COL940_011854 [Colletotrichum noveboracense]
MSKDIPTLQDRRGFPAWQKAIQKSLTPDQWETVTWTEGGPPENLSLCLLWEKARAQAYNTIIQSIPDMILISLGAHDEFNALREFYCAEHDYSVEEVPGGCPRELYKVISAQIRCIANADPAKFENMGQYAARMWLSKMCASTLTP